MRKLASVLSLILIFTIPWENAIRFGELGTLTRVLGILTAGIWLISIFGVGKIRKPHAFHLLVILFVIWNVSSLFWTLGYNETIKNIKTYLQLAILVWIIWDLNRTQKSFVNSLQAYILGSYVTIGSTFNNYLSGRIISLYQQGRFTGASLNAGDLALILALGIPIAWHLLIRSENGIRSSILRTIYFVYIPSSIFAILLTGSRAALFSLAVAIFYIIGTLNSLKLSYRILISISLMLILTLLIPRIPQFTMNRLATVGESIFNRDLGGRVSLWRLSFTEFINHPILGVGSGALNAGSQLGAFAHNTYISVLSELGLVGICILLAILATVINQVIKQPDHYAKLWLSVLLILLIGISNLTWEFRKQTWLILDLIVVSASLFTGTNYQTKYHSEMLLGKLKTHPEIEC